MESERKPLTPAQQRAAEADLKKAQAAAATAAQAARDAQEAANKLGRRLPLPAPVTLVTGAPPARGNRRKFSLELQREYLDAIARGVGRTNALKLVGVTREMAKRVREADPDFAEAEQVAEEDACDLVEDALFKAATNGNVDAMKTWLFGRRSKRWVPPQKMQVEVSGQVEHIDVAAEMSEIVALQARLATRMALRTPETPALEAGVSDAEIVED